jgi:polysaccharide pyruvyl transferase WcaK-like protein
MKLSEFFKSNLDNSFLVGFYGGGNLGDELLLEVILNLLKKNGARNISFYYSAPDLYPIFHHDFGYSQVNPKNKVSFLKNLLSSKNIIIGGGGLWGLDFNLNILILSTILLISRIFLCKKIYMIGVGNYGSKPVLGRLAARFAGWSSSLIIVRDIESRNNFGFVANKVFLEDDISFNLPLISDSDYNADLNILESRISPPEDLVLVSFRRFKKEYSNDYAQVLLKAIENSPNVNFLITTFEPKEVDPEGFKLAMSIASNNPKIQVLEFRYNPIALYLYMRIHHGRLKIITPQYHGMALAYLAGVKFMPLAYDNKCFELLNRIGEKKAISIYDVSYPEILDFINSK